MKSLFMAILFITAIVLGIADAESMNIFYATKIGSVACLFGMAVMAEWT